MRQLLVRYTIKPGHVQENTRHIEALFDELKAKAPDGVRYVCFLTEDGTYVHFLEVEDGALSVSDLDAFGPYQEKLEERLVAPAIPGPAKVVGNYRMLGDQTRR
jgi:hypothetical protein